MQHFIIVVKLEAAVQNTQECPFGGSLRETQLNSKKTSGKLGSLPFIFEEPGRRFSRSDKYSTAGKCLEHSGQGRRLGRGHRREDMRYKFCNYYQKLWSFVVCPSRHLLYSRYMARLRVRVGVTHLPTFCLWIISVKVAYRPESSVSWRTLKCLTSQNQTQSSELYFLALVYFYYIFFQKTEIRS